MTKNYIVLARKYRPQHLADVVGQDVTIQILKNAIISSKLPHATLLTGTRGIGKTTIARIIAKCINCTGSTKEDEFDCCNACDNCIAIAKSSHPDILELDAASNTGVGDVREIIDSAKYRPIQAKYKIYIIDEVHMLSNSAFNALLKTLEEPPSHVKFIFATTEIDKIPQTIISRCLQFRLRPLSSKIISEKCEEILKLEGYDCENDVTTIIAKAANGSMRDALSIMESAMLFSAKNKKLLLEPVTEMLGYSKRSDIADIFINLCNAEIKTVIEKAKKLYDVGIEVETIINNLMLLIHEITKFKIKNDYSSAFLWDGNTISVDVLSNIDMKFLLTAWNVLNDFILAKNTSMIHLEMTLIKLAHLEKIINDGGCNDENFDATSIIQSGSESKNLSTNITFKKSSENIIKTLIEKSEGTLSSAFEQIAKIKVLDMNFSVDTMQITMFNQLRVLLAFLLDIGKTILYHKLSVSVKVMKFDLYTNTIILSKINKKDGDVVEKIRKDLSDITKVKWNITTSNEDGMSYSEFLTYLDKQHEKTVTQSDIVKNIMNEFSLTIDNITKDKKSDQNVCIIESNEIH